MKKILMISALAFLLVGCNSTPEEIENKARSEGFENNLPDGCKLKVPGRVNGDLIVLVVCDGRTVTSSLRAWDEFHYDPATKMSRTERHFSRVIHVGPKTS